MGAGLRIAPFLVLGLIPFACSGLKKPELQTGTSGCDLTMAPPGMGTLTSVAVATGLTRPVNLVNSPLASKTFFVLDANGRINSVSQETGAPTAFLNITDRVTDLDGGGDERGLLGMALHPQFLLNKKFYLNYTTKGALRTRISEFTATPAGLGDAASEKILSEIAQPYRNHNGGEIAFGPDGYLYIGMGDGGSGGDPQGHGQNLSSLLGKILRIDVDSASPYAIPNDNPFVGVATARGEIWAYGLRNPWRFSFDRVTHDLWAGDVGQNAYEEIDIIKKGKNYGWNTMEGKHCYIDPSCVQAGLELPVFEYGRSEGLSVTGGFVYRGKKFPNLVGSYIFGDYGSGQIWGVRWNGSQITEQKVLSTSGVNLSTFGEDADGELYFASVSGGLYRLEEQPTATLFPGKLSQTGCFSSLSPLQPISKFVPYDVNSPLWSDGAEKDRFIQMPEGMTFGYSDADPWMVPVGTVFLKNFYLPQRDGSRRIVETRFLIRLGSGFRGLSYHWNDTQTDATWFSGAGVEAKTIWENGSEQTFDYYFPSGNDCLRCHNNSAGGALGINTLQLNRDTAAGQHQFSFFVRKGLLKSGDLPPVIEPLKKLVDYRDTRHAAAERARSLLHVQCSSCHNPGNVSGQGRQDLRYLTALDQMNICNATPEAGDLGVADAKILFPTNPDKSLLFLRTHSLDSRTRMPPLASNRRDDVGVALLRDWISATTRCP